ncbi:efflux RND transporter periplasmic adaptor subunit [uncultured Victivallis sp.]|uniref:efflux RND transporter periplasmic adaptor subunit n=1 Tax=uncultured Victivallis sp. TaxID=354118 RepID=UPI0025F6ECA9|nr:efflux RND transporter periplasmic adaptor subunit [uncultured Victivallis sp.]
MHTFWYQIPVAAAWLAVLMLAGCDREAPGQDAASAPAKVVAKQPRQMEFVQKIRVQANVESQESAEISSRTSGNLDLIPVGEGDRVKKGDLLFQVDRINLENNVRSQKKNVEVAEAELHIARINLNLARTVRDKAKVDLDRAERLKTSQAVSMDAYERAKLSFDQADAEIAKAEAQAGFAAARVEQEKAHLETAEKSLSDSIIRAPFAGVITLTDKDRDEYVKDGTVILKIENPDRLQLVTMISSNYYNQVIPGKTTAKILSTSGKELAELPVTFRSPAVDPLSRTFTVKIAVPMSLEFVSGQLYEVDLILRRVEGRGIPNEAVLTRAGNRKAVFVVTPQQKAAEITVKTGIVDGSWTMLRDPEVLKDQPVIVEGQSFLEPGEPVEVIQTGTAPAK